MIESTDKLIRIIAGILDGSLHSVWLYGSVVFHDFHLGWSDIDLLVLANEPLTEGQAQHLVTLRQTLLEREPGNLYYRSFEGCITSLNEYLSQSWVRLVYWGTTGQRVTDRYTPDTFSAFELAKYGKAVYGDGDRSIFAMPSQSEMVDAVRQHLASIRKYAVQTDESLYSCGWLLDIARCVYTLRHQDVTAKTQAGIWALTEHIFPDEAPLRKTLGIRENPLAFKDREDVKRWLRKLGPTVQQYADVLEKELTRI